MRHLTRLAVALALLALPLIAFAQEAAASLPSDLPGLLGWFAETHKAGNWTLLIGGALTLFLRFTPVVKPWLDKLPAEATKWVAGALALIGALATGLMAGVPVFTALLNGAKVALVAVGGWEMILKPLLVKLGLQKADA